MRRQAGGDGPPQLRRPSPHRAATRLKERRLRAFELAGGDCEATLRHPRGARRRVDEARSEQSLERDAERDDVEHTVNQPRARSDGWLSARAHDPRQEEVDLAELVEQLPGSRPPGHDVFDHVGEHKRWPIGHDRMVPTSQPQGVARNVYDRLEVQRHCARSGEPEPRA